MYIHNFFKAVGDNIRPSFPFNKAAIASFLYIYIYLNSIFSVIIPLTFDNGNVSLIQIFTALLSFGCQFFFCASKLTVDSYIQYFIKKQNLLKTVKFMDP